jgi:hypothetical protein
MIVGAPKSGTTSLKSYLGQHPAIFAHPQREFIYFANDEEYSRGYERAWQLYFRDARPGRIVAAKSVAMMYSPTAMRRLKEHNPAAQVVLVLRDPVARAYSEFAYARRRGRETDDRFEDAVRRCMETEDMNPLEPGAYLVRGRYVQFLEDILGLFPPGQVNVVPFEAIAEDPVAACQGLYRKFGSLDHSFTPSSIRGENSAAGVWSQFLLSLTSDRRRLRGLRRRLQPLLSERNRQRIKAALQRINDRPIALPEMSEHTRRELADYYAPWNRRLADRLDMSFGRWIAPR